MQNYVKFAEIKNVNSSQNKKKTKIMAKTQSGTTTNFSLTSTSFECFTSWPLITEFGYKKISINI